MRNLVLTAIAALACTSAAHAAIVITEVDPNGSSTASYGGDWFEVTNTGPAAVDLSTYSVDDDSNLFAFAVPLRGVTSLSAGKSAVFIEATTTGAYDATLAATRIANFQTAWFGTNIPAGFTIGTYGGSGLGLSATNGDQVNLFDASGNKVTGVNFGLTALTATLDNRFGTQTGTNNPTIATPSVVGVNGAFLSPGSNEIGSPGVVPEPMGLAAVALGAAGLLRRRRA